jgi:hypothetical protein
MPLHRVIWEIDIDAEDACAAAQRAQEIQRDPASSATVFKVQKPNGTVATFDLAPPPPDQRSRRRVEIARRHL